MGLLEQAIHELTDDTLEYYALIYEKDPRENYRGHNDDLFNVAIPDDLDDFDGWEDARFEIEHFEDANAWYTFFIYCTCNLEKVIVLAHSWRDELLEYIYDDIQHNDIDMYTSQCAKALRVLERITKKWPLEVCND